jgi:hypothetical protein
MSDKQIPKDKSVSTGQKIVIPENIPTSVSSTKLERIIETLIKTPPPKKVKGE